MLCHRCGNKNVKPGGACSVCGAKIPLPYLRRINPVFEFILRYLFGLVIILIMSGVIYFFDMGSTKNEPASTTGESFSGTLVDPLLYKATVQSDAIIYTEPSIESKKDETEKLLMGDEIFVIKDEGGWISFRITPEDAGWKGYIEKRHIDESTIVSIYDSPDRWLERNRNDELCDYADSWKKNYLVVYYKIGLNAVYVNSSKWYSLDVEEATSLVKDMSSCFGESGASLRVTVYDNSSGKQLAKCSSLGGIQYF